MKQNGRRLLMAAGMLSLLAACERGGSNSAVMPKKDEPTPAAPAVFRVRFETSKGPFVVESHRAWSPNGVDRFHQLVSSGFYDNTRFFRVVEGFVVQFGMHGDPEVARAWESLTIPDDTLVESNVRGTVTFATVSGTPNSRTTQLFINLGHNTNLNGMGFTPIGRVVEGMEVVDKLHAGYGDGPPFGNGPDQQMMTKEGNAYLEREFPQLDFIRTARVVGTSATDSTVRGDTTRT